MIKFIPGLVVAACLLSCSPIDPNEISVVSYFNLDSLTTSQIDYLVNDNKKLVKTISMDDKDERRVIELDSGGWREELGFIDQFDINQPRLVGAYDSTKLKDGSVRYFPRTNAELPIRYLEVKKGSNGVTEISGHLVEKNNIYETSLEGNIYFNENKLTSYQLRGYQKILLKDSVFYNIKAEIIE